MSVFTSFVTQTIPVPDDPGQTVTIRKLAPKHLKAAMTAMQRAALVEFAELKRLGATEVLADIQKLQDDEATLASARRADPLLLYDRTILLQKGIIGWSYERNHDDLEALEDLDDERAEYLARTILRLAKPSLFAAKDFPDRVKTEAMTESEAQAQEMQAAEEAEQKND